MATIKARIHRNSSEEMKRLGERCLKLREQGVSLSNIAHRFGVSYFTICRWIDKVNIGKKGR